MEIQLNLTTQSWNAVRFLALSVFVYPLLEVTFGNVLAKSRASRVKKGSRLRLRHGFSRLIDFNQELDSKSSYELIFGYSLAAILFALGFLTEYGSGTTLVNITAPMNLERIPEIVIIRDQTTLSSNSTSQNILAGIPTDENAVFRKMFVATFDEYNHTFSKVLLQEAANKKLYSTSLPISEFSEHFPWDRTIDMTEIEITWVEYGMVLIVRGAYGYPGVLMQWKCIVLSCKLPSSSALITPQRGIVQNVYDIPFPRPTDLDNFVKRWLSIQSDPDMIKHIGGYWLKGRAIEVGDVAGLKGSECWLLQDGNKRSDIKCDTVLEHILQRIRIGETNVAYTAEPVKYSVTAIDSPQIRLDTNNALTTWDLVTKQNDDDDSKGPLKLYGLYFQQVGNRVETYYSLRSEEQECLMGDVGVCIARNDSREVTIYRRGVSDLGWAHRTFMAKFRTSQSLLMDKEEILSSWYSALVTEITLQLKVFQNTSPGPISITVVTGNVLELKAGKELWARCILGKREVATVNTFFVAATSSLFVVLLLGIAGVFVFWRNERIDSDTMLRKAAMSSTSAWDCNSIPSFPPTIGLIRSEMNAEHIQAFYEKDSRQLKFVDDME